MSINYYRTDIYEPNSIGYRQPVTSELLNPKLDQIRTFLLRAIARAAQTRSWAHDLSLATIYTNALMQAQQAETLSHLAAVRSNSPNKTLHVSFYEAKDGSTPPDSGVSRERLFGQLTLRPLSELTKIPTYTDAYGDIRPRRNVSITRDGETLAEDHPLYWALNGEPDRFWIDDSAAPNQVTTLTISLPPGVRNELNRLTFVPFPHRACTITDLSYRTPSGFRTAPGFLESYDPVRVHFVPGEFEDEFRIMLRANTIPVGSESGSLWGAVTIDAALVDYVSTGYAYSAVSAIGSDTFSRITSFTADYFIDSSVPTSLHSTPPVQFELQKTDGTVVYSSVSNRYPLRKGDPPLAVSGSPTTLWLKTTLNEPIDRVTPVVRNATFTYE